MDYSFELDFQVRDYECDLQGIVNNATYLNYLEHTRHEFLKFKGVDFCQLSQEGYDLVVVRSELDYHFPLRSGDTFQVVLNVVRKGKLRLVFDQRVIRSDGRKILSGVIIGTCLNAQGRPCYHEAMELILS